VYELLTYVRLAHRCAHTIHDKAVKLLSETKVFIYAARLPQSYWNEQ